MEDQKLESLKALVEKKLELNKESKLGTPEYQENKESINKLIAGLSADKTKYLKILCKQEYDNLLHFFSADIQDAQKKSMDKKMEIVMACSDLLAKSKVKAKPAPEMGN